MEPINFYDLRDACNEVKRDYSALKDVDFFSFVMNRYDHMVGQNVYIPFDYLEDDFHDEADVEYVSQSLPEGESYEDIKEFYLTLKYEYGDVWMMGINW